jgi:hypothetical protein
LQAAVALSNKKQKAVTTTANNTSGTAASKRAVAVAAVASSDDSSDDDNDDRSATADNSYSHSTRKSNGPTDPVTVTNHHCSHHVNDDASVSDNSNSYSDSDSIHDDVDNDIDDDDDDECEFDVDEALILQRDSILRNSEVHGTAFVVCQVCVLSAVLIYIHACVCNAIVVTCSY